MSGRRFSAGFRKFTLANVPGADAIACAAWYPTDAAEAEVAEGAWRFRVAVAAAPVGGKFPLVLISHGTGSSWREHHDTAEFLTRRGFIVAAASHPGDSYDAPGQSPGGLDAAGTRSRDVSRLIDAVLASNLASNIEADRVGVAGFSIGGYTAFVLAGAQPDFRKIATHPADDPPSIYFDAAQAPRAAIARRLLEGPQPARDRRIGAIFAMAPALGFLFDKSGLADVRVPVRLYRAEHDQILHHPYDGETFRRMLPVEPEFVVVKGAGHFAFLAPAPGRLIEALPDIFVDANGFDRVAFHDRLNAEADAFFTKAFAT